MRVRILKDGALIAENSNVVLLTGVQYIANHLAGNQNLGIAFSKAAIALAPSPAPQYPKLITTFPTSGTDTPTETNTITTTVTPDTSDQSNPKIIVEVSIEFTITGTREFNEVALYIGPSPDEVLYAYSRFPANQTLTSATYVFNWQFIFSI